MWTATQVIGVPDGDNGLIYRSTEREVDDSQV